MSNYMVESEFVCLLFRELHPRLHVLLQNTHLGDNHCPEVTHMCLRTHDITYLSTCLYQFSTSYCATIVSSIPLLSTREPYCSSPLGLGVLQTRLSTFCPPEQRHLAANAFLLPPHNDRTSETFNF